jgi:putative tail protein
VTDGRAQAVVPFAHPGSRVLMPVSCCPHPFDGRRVDYAVPEGLTIAEIIELIQPDPLLRTHGVAFIGEHMISREVWHGVRPKAGALLSIRLLPSSGRTAAMIGLMVLAVAIAVAVPFLAPVVGAALSVGATTALAITSAAGAVVLAGATLAVNMLLPPPGPQLAKHYGNESPTYAISGGRNQARPWEKVPFLLGRFKLTPPYASQPYREVVGADTYWRTIFAPAHGPVVVDEMRIGNTLLSNFQGVETEFRRGYWSMPDKGNWNAGSGTFPSSPSFGDTWTCSVAGTVAGVAYTVGQTITFNGLAASTSASAWDLDQGKPFALYPNDVFEDALSAAVKHATPVVRATQANADEIAVELVFERGLVHIDNSPPGKRADGSVALRIEQSPTGADTWTTVLEKTITGRQTTPLYWGHRWKSSDVGAQDANRQYDIRATRVSGDMDEDRNFGNFTWYSLKTFTMGNPVPVPGVALMAVRIKASGQLSGALDEFNAVCRSICRDWDAASGAWMWRPTSSPAAHFRHVLQHPTRQQPASDAQIDLARLAYWDGVTRPANRTFNGVFDAKTSLYDALIQIARVGRAVPTLRDLKYSVIIDEPKTAPVRLFTPRNSWDYSGELTHAPLPHAYRIGFVNAAKDWSAQEVVVYDDGYDASNATRIDLVQWPGIYDHDQAWKEGRFHLAQQRLRREVHKITTDFEHLACERGDLVALQHDVIAVGLGAARIKSVTDDGTYALSVTLDNGLTMEAGKSYGLRARRVVGGAQRTDLYAVNAGAGEQVTLTFTSPPLLADAPQAGDLVAFGELGRETLRTLVRDIAPRNDLSAVLTLIAEAPAVHTAELGGSIPAYDPVVTRPAALPAPVVTDIRSDARVMRLTASRALITRVVFSLQPIFAGDAEVIVFLKPTGTDGAWRTATIDDRTRDSVAISGVESAANYSFRLGYRHRDYLSSPLTQIDGYHVVGREAPPADLQNLSLAVVGGQALLRWDLPADIDVQAGGWIAFRHTPETSGATWPNSTSIGRAVNGDQTHVFLPLKPGTYLARVYDCDGRESAGTASFATKQASVLNFVPLDDLQEDPTFAGSKTDCEVVSGALQLSSGNFDAVTDVDALADWDSAGAAVFAAGTYGFAAGLDFGAVERVRLTSHLKTQAVNLYADIDGEDAIDSLSDFDGVTGAPIDAALWGKLTDDDPAGSPSWGPFMRIDSAEISARAVGQLECRLETDDPTYNIQVLELRLTAEQVA